VQVDAEIRGGTRHAGRDRPPPREEDHVPRTRTKLELLERLPLFDSCSRGQLRLAGRHAELIQVPGGELIIREGRPGYEFFTVAEGTASVTRDGRAVAVLGPGDHFGELSLLAGTARDATVTALTPMELVVIDRRAFRGLLTELPDFSRRILENLARRLHQSDVCGPGGPEARLG
jgi:CRP-like cAMP-binding protein